MADPNCVNICLGNELLREIDDYAEDSHISRIEAMKELIGIAKRSRQSLKTWGSRNPAIRPPSMPVKYSYDGGFRPMGQLRGDIK